MVNGMNGTEFVFWAFAVLGTVFFFLRVIAMAAGLHVGGHDVLGHVPMDSGGDPHGHSSQDSGDAFKLVSVQSLTGFFMMFGWMGLAAYKQFGWAAFPSFAAASVAGLAAMAATALVFKMMSGLTSPGSRFTTGATVGLSGTVYARIPAEGRGQVRLTVEGITRIVDAVSEDAVDLDSFSEIQAIRAVDDRTVSVRKRR